MTGRGHRFRGGSRARCQGQVIVLLPIVAFMMFCFFLISVNTNAIATKKMTLQTVTDAAARSGAYVQASALSAESFWNALIHEVIAPVELVLEALIPVPIVGEFAEPLFDAMEVVQEGIELTQGAIYGLAEATIEPSIIGTGYQNELYGDVKSSGDKIYTTWVPSNFSKTPITLGMSEEPDPEFEEVEAMLYLRNDKDGKVNEGVVVVGLMKAHLPVKGLFSFQGEDHMWLVATSAAKPYYYKDKDDQIRKNQLSKKAMEPPPMPAMLQWNGGWDARLVSVQTALPGGGKPGGAAGMAKLAGMMAANDAYIFKNTDELGDYIKYVGEERVDNIGHKADGMISSLIKGISDAEGSVESIAKKLAGLF